MSVKPSYGVIVGRFQVNDLHEGHRELIEAVYARHQKVIIFLGVSPTGLTKRHPLDFSARERMIKAAYPKALVLPLEDKMTDEMWSKQLDSSIRLVAQYGDVTLYGGRDSFVPHYCGDFTPKELALTKTGFSGEQIRAKLTNVVMESPEFRAGMIYAATNQYNRVITTVDIILYHQFIKSSNPYTYEHSPLQLQFLLGRKPGEPGWRFAGGHAEPGTETFEQDARDEAMQETGLDIIKLEYIGSCRVPDWRWENEESKIKTLIFAGETGSMGARGGSDLPEVKWFEPKKMTRGLFVDTHKPLYDIVCKKFPLCIFGEHVAEIEEAARG